MGPVAAHGHARLHYRLHLYRHAGLLGAGTNHPAGTDRLGLRGLLFPRSPLHRRGRHHADAGALPLCLPAQPRRFSQSVHLCAGCQPHPGQRAMAHLPVRRPAIGPTSDNRRAVAGIDGNPRGFWHRAVFRSLYLYHRHLPHLVRHRQCRRRGPTGRRADVFRDDSDSSGALLPTPRPLPPHQPPPSGYPPLFTAGHAGRGGNWLLLRHRRIGISATRHSIAELDA